RAHAVPDRARPRRDRAVRARARDPARRNRRRRHGRVRDPDRPGDRELVLAARALATGPAEPGYPRGGTRLALLAPPPVAIAAPAASAARYSFGRQGGNIEPYTVNISTTGAVTTSGPAKVGRTKLSARQLKSLATTLAGAGFSTLPATTFCL